MAREKPTEIECELALANDDIERINRQIKKSKIVPINIAHRLRHSKEWRKDVLTRLSGVRYG